MSEIKVKGPEARWYIVQTYSGHENSVRQDLMQRATSLGMNDVIFDAIVPEETYIEKKADGKEKEKVRQTFPGYVFVQMVVNEASWYVVRNTPRVTGFLGSSGGGTWPTPLREEEIKPILLKVGAISKPNYDRLLGKVVEIISGSFAGQQGLVSEVDNEQEKITVNVEMFGRDTPTVIKFEDFKEIE